MGGPCLKVNGRNQPYVRNSLFEARRASTLLAATVGWEPPVHALLVFDTTGGVDLTIKSQPDAVTVMGHRSVIAWLRKRPTLLTLQEVSEVFGVARRSTTWVTR